MRAACKSFVIFRRTRPRPVLHRCPPPGDCPV